MSYKKIIVTYTVKGKEISKYKIIFSIYNNYIIEKMLFSIFFNLNCLTITALHFLNIFFIIINYFKLENA